MTSKTVNAMAGKLRVAVVDAQPLFRAGVACALRTCEGVELLAEGECAADALRIANKHPLDILLLDLGIPGGGGETIASIVRMWPAIRIVVLTTSERVEDVTSCMQTGVRGYALKNIDTPELAKMLRSVAADEVYLTPSLGARLFAQSAAAQRQPAAATAADVANLTSREEEILSQVSVGSTNKEIARKLNISDKTVKYYMTNILQKLQVRNRVEAVIAARDRQRKTG